MKRPLALLIILLSAFAQAQTRATRLLLIVPFENQSKAPGLEWMGDSFPEVIGQTLGKSRLFVVSRQERLYALDRLGIPATVRPSRATLLRIAQEMDVDYIVLGSYSYDGRTFSARAQAIDVKRLKLSSEAAETGGLPQAIEIESALAGRISQEIEALGGPPAVHASASTLRLDALENYIKGVQASAIVDRLRFLKEAARLAPAYLPILIALGRTYFDNRDYEQAATWLAKVQKTDALASEANFFFGLASYYQGNYAAAEDAFHFTAQRLPLIEVYNNLGVVSARRGKKDAVEYFERAANADTRDPDYHFNLAVASYRGGDPARAAHEAKEALALSPQDPEARTLLQIVNGSLPIQGQKLPLERVKRNYDESSYRQLALEIQNVNEMRYAELPPAKHAEAHIARGNELLLQGVPDEAENEFREAVILDPTNALAHAGLAEILEGRNEITAARREALTANRIAPSAQAYLVLARLEIKQQRPQAAMEFVERALAIDPANPKVAALRAQLTAKQP